MSIPGSAPALFFQAAAADAAAAGPTKSLRFNSGDSAYLNKTFSSAGTLTTFTISGWVKRTSLGSYTPILLSADTSSTTEVAFTTDNKLQFVDGSTVYRKTDAVFRDVSAWYHIVVTWDTTNSTVADRCRIYVNGAEQSYSTEATISENATTDINTTDIHYVGRQSNTYTNCYMADIYFIDGSALGPTSFGAYDDNGVWQSAAYSGAYGTNGFHLDFADGSDLGDDNSGNGNDFTPNNLSGHDGSVATANGALPILNTTGTYGGTVGSGTRTDSSSSSIVLALPLNGANNGTTWSDQSATIKGSGSAKTITRNNDPITSTAESFFYGSSTYFDGSGDRLVLGNASDLSFTGDFTVETWLYISDSSTTSYPNGDRQIVGVWTGSNNDWLMTYSGTGSHNTFLFQIYTGGSTVFFSSGVDMSNYVGQWVHLATVRNSGSIQNYVNGVASGSAYSNSASFGQSSNVAVGGRVGNDANSVKGYLSDLRIYLSAKYTGNFDVPSRTGGSGCDSLFDVPTNDTTNTDSGVGGELSGNYPTFNPLSQQYSTANHVLTNGNLQVGDSSTSKGNYALEIATMAAPPSNKWYWEMTLDDKNSAERRCIGVVATDADFATYLPQDNLDDGFVGLWCETGQKIINGSRTSYGASATDGDVIGVALDQDGDTVTFYKNNSSQGSISLPTNMQGKSILPAVISIQQDENVIANFGQRPWAYSAPSNHKALCTTNLPTPTIADGSDYFETAIWSGDSASSRTIATGFNPDFVWVKNRAVAGRSHYLYDVVRGFGANKELVSNTTDEEGSSNHLTQNHGYVSATTSTGFTLAAGATNSNYTNQSGQTYVGWAWDAGTSTASNTDGSITSNVRASQTAGTSIVTYTGSGSAGTVGHGLNAAPEMIILKGRNFSDDWRVYHKYLDATEPEDYYLILQSTNGKSGDQNASFMNDTAPTNSVFSLGTDSAINGSSRTMVAYCFAPVAGFSAMGTYEGNGSSDGPFVYTGFRPAFLMYKNVDGSFNWLMIDSARSPINYMSKTLNPNTNGSESSRSTNDAFDFLSNGFKVRAGGSNARNQNGSTFIWYAVAENPFQANGGLAR